MAKFSYKAINEIGNNVSGVIDAESEEAARLMVSNRGYIPVAIREAKNDWESSQTDIWDKLKWIKTWELILFTKQFGTMIRAGVPMLNLFHILELQTENSKLKKVIGTMSQDIREGISLHKAFKKHPKIFSPLYCSVIYAGESSDNLSGVLEHLIYIMEHEHKIKSDIRAALRYPLIVIFFLMVAFFVMLTFVVPTYVKVFVNAGITLPLPTQIAISLYQFLVSFWYLLLIGIIASTIALIMFLKTEQGKYIKDMMIMRIPVLGILLIKTAMSRFSSIFAILQKSGVAILDSMKILSGTIGNMPISRELTKIRDCIEKGDNISTPLRAARYFTPMMVNMVAIGEESGNLEEMLIEIAAHYDSEVEFAMKRMSELVGPVLTIGMAVVVGFFALAIFLPMWDLSQMVK